MTDPRRANVKFLALLTLACIAAAFPTKPAAQNAATKQQSPNGKIVFQSTQGGDGFVNDIYVMDADGKRQTRLTDGPSDDTAPLWSPTGDQIAFLSDRGGNGFEIYLMNPDGSNQRPLRGAADGGPIIGAHIEWSPDGKRLKYETSGFELGDIYVVEAVAPGGGDSVVPPQVINSSRPSGMNDTQASWSPDGTRFVFRSVGCDGCGISELYTMNADGTNRVQVTNVTGFESAPRWSPDGTRIAYDADRNGARGIYVKNADGTGAEVKASGGVATSGGAAWSSNGTRLAFVSDAGAVYAAGPDGSGLMLLTDVPAVSSTLLWSPDCAKLAFHSSNGNAVDLYVVNSDGSRRKADNYTKSRRDDDFASSWQRMPTQ
jgi:TolB protein